MRYAFNARSTTAVSVPLSRPISARARSTISASSWTVTLAFRSAVLLTVPGDAVNVEEQLSVGSVLDSGAFRLIRARRIRT